MKYKYQDITLRTFECEDIPLKVEWINSSNNNKFLHYNIPITVSGTQSWFYNKDINRLDCIIEYNDIPVGIIGLLNIDDLNKKAEYYITIGEIRVKRHGVATKATQALLQYGFNELGLKKIYLNVDEENEAARRLYEKCGFVCEGVFLKDMLFKGKWINRMRYAIFNEYEEVNKK